MKKILCTQFAALFLICSVGYSQKIDLDKEVWTHNLITLPERGDLSSLKTYSVSMFANQGNLERLGLTSNKIEDALKLDGYVYTTNLADIMVQVRIDDLTGSVEDVRTKVTSEYEGGKDVKKTTYLPVTLYEIPTSIKIINGVTNEILFNGIMGGSDNPVVVESGEFPSYEAAKATFKGTEEKRLEKLKEKYYSTFASVFKGFRTKYDFKIDSETEIFWHVDLKKNPEFTEFNDKLKLAKEVFANSKAWDDIKVTREQLTPIMEFWHENANKISGSDKATRKLKYAYLINLGKTQLWLDMLDEAAITAQKIIENDYDRKDGKMLLSWVDYIRKLLKTSPNNTRHFPRDGFTSSSQFKSNEIQPIPFVLPNPPEGFKALPGTMTDVLGVTHEGALWVKGQTLKGLSFEPSEETVFAYEKNRGLAKQAIDLKEVDQIILKSGEKFGRFKYQGFNMFFQELREKGNIKILKYMRSNESDGSMNLIFELNNGKEMCLMNNKTGVIKSVGALLPNASIKKTLEFYSGCESLRVKIAAEEFGKMNHLDGQLKALDFYEQNCK